MFSNYGKHEMTTLKLIDKMALGTNLEEEFNSYGLFEKDIEFIKDLIHASIFKSADPDTTYGEKVMKIIKTRNIIEPLGFTIIIEFPKFWYLGSPISVKNRH